MDLGWNGTGIVQKASIARVRADIQNADSQG